MIDKDCTTVFPAASVAVYSKIVSPMSNSAPGDIVDVTVGVTPEVSVAIDSVQETSTGASSAEGIYFVIGLGKEENVGASASAKNSWYTNSSVLLMRNVNDMFCDSPDVLF